MSLEEKKKSRFRNIKIKKCQLLYLKKNCWMGTKRAKMAERAEMAYKGGGSWKGTVTSLLQRHNHKYRCEKITNDKEKTMPPPPFKGPLITSSWQWHTGSRRRPRPPHREASSV
jgi:hypothetical protein